MGSGALLHNALKGSERSRGVGSIIVFLGKPADAKRFEPIPMHATPVDPPVISVKHYDPALPPLDFSNTTSEPLSSCGLCLRLIGDWGASHESKQAKSDG